MQLQGQLTGTNEAGSNVLIAQQSMWLCSSAGRKLRILSGRINTGVVDALQGSKLLRGKPDTRWQMGMLSLPSTLLVLLYRRTRYELDQVSGGQVLHG